MKQKHLLAGIFTIILAFSLVSCDDSSSKKSDSSPAPPAAPAAPVLAAGDRLIDISWDAVSGADNYQVWYNASDSLSTAAQYTGDTDTADTLCTIPGLDYRSTYHVWIRAVNGGGISGYSDSSSATIEPPAAGYSETVTAGAVSFDIVYVRGGFTISMGTGDTESGTVDDDFWMAETEATNELVAAVYQWAYDSGKFDTDGDGDVDGDDNAIVNDTMISLYGANLINTDESMSGQIHFDGSAAAGSEFSVETFYETHPCIEISWQGAVMFCNWLTEMVDGTTDEVVYSWTDNGDDDGISGDNIWQHGETDADNARTGFRLPEESEWELAARYLGTTEPATGDDLDIERLTTDVDGTTYYWTPGDYASGATADTGDFDASDAVAWFGYEVTYGVGNTTSSNIVATKGPNALGIYDMSGNISEWCYTSGMQGSDLVRVHKGGSWRYEISSSSLGFRILPSPMEGGYEVGFRVARDSY